MLSDQLKLPQDLAQNFLQNNAKVVKHELSPDISLLLNSLSFSHFIKFVKCDTPLQRAFMH
jgi:hypothetical protein